MGARDPVAFERGGQSIMRRRKRRYDRALPSEREIWIFVASGNETGDQEVREALFGGFKTPLISSQSQRRLYVAPALRPAKGCRASLVGLRYISRFRNATRQDEERFGTNCLRARNACTDKNFPPDSPSRLLPISCNSLRRTPDLRSAQRRLGFGFQRRPLLHQIVEALVGARADFLVGLPDLAARRSPADR